MVRIKTGEILQIGDFSAVPVEDSIITRTVNIQYLHKFIIQTNICLTLM